jgi:bifunctional DNase/RNase
MIDAAKQGSRPIALLLLLGSFLAAGCRGATEVREIEVSVSRVAVDEMSRSPVVLLEDKDQTVSLPIWIGLSEAQAIALEMEGVAPPRPMTHDLLKQVLDRLGVELRRVLISELRGNTYYARIYLVSSGSEHEIDSRPSDAIALAVRFRKPIFVTAELVQRQQQRVVAADGGSTTSVAGVTVQGISPELAEHFAVPEGQGVVVADVARDARHELRRGDVILEIDGKPVHGIRDFRDRVAALNGEADLAVKRGEALLHVAFDPSVISPQR